MSDERTAWNSTLRPGKPLERKTPLRRKSPIPAVNRARRKALFERGYGSEEFVEWIKSQPCVVFGCERTNIHAAHVVSRGAGGGPEDVVPLCTHHHTEQHAMGIQTFQDVHQLDLDLEAGRVWQEWTEVGR